MGGVARRASLFRLYGPMHHFCLFDFLGDLGMALGTEFFPFRGEQLFVRSTMGVMA